MPNFIDRSTRERPRATSTQHFSSNSLRHDCRVSPHRDRRPSAREPTKVLGRAAADESSICLLDLSRSWPRTDHELRPTRHRRSASQPARCSQWFAGARWNLAARSTHGANLPIVTGSVFTSMEDSLPTSLKSLRRPAGRTRDDRSNLRGLRRARSRYHRTARSLLLGGSVPRTQSESPAEPVATGRLVGSIDTIIPRHLRQTLESETPALRRWVV